MTKQEQINKIAGELLAYQPLIDIPFEQFYKVARAIVDLGYKKIDKNSIILTKEEYIDLTRDCVKEQKIQAVKEFAEKVEEKALSHCRIINCYELKFIETTIDELLEEYEVEE